MKRCSRCGLTKPLDAFVSNPRNRDGPPGRSCGVCRRGLAHSNCNSGIGMLGDDPAMLRRAADNLERAQGLTAALRMAAPVQDSLFVIDGDAG